MLKLRHLWVAFPAFAATGTILLIASHWDPSWKTPGWVLVGLGFSPVLVALACLVAGMTLLFTIAPILMIRDALRRRRCLRALAALERRDAEPSEYAPCLAALRRLLVTVVGCNRGGRRCSVHLWTLDAIDRRVLDEQCVSRRLLIDFASDDALEEVASRSSDPCAPAAWWERAGREGCVRDDVAPREIVAAWARREELAPFDVPAALRKEDGVERCPRGGG